MLETTLQLELYDFLDCFLDYTTVTSQVQAEETEELISPLLMIPGLLYENT